MRFNAFVVTLAGIALVALSLLILEWQGDQPFASFSLEEFRSDDPPRFQPLLQAFLTRGWYALSGIAVLSGLVATVCGPRGRWVAALGFAVIGAGLAVSAINAWGWGGLSGPDEINRWSVHAVAGTCLVLSLLCAVGVTSAPAVIGVASSVLCLVGFGWLVIAIIADDGADLRWYSWLAPIGFAVLAGGAVLSRRAGETTDRAGDSGRSPYRG